MTTRFLKPRAPTSLLAMTTASATLALPARANNGFQVILFNEAGATAYVQFGPTAAAASGFALQPGAYGDPIEVPDQETQISAILESGTGNLRVTLTLNRGMP